MSWHSPLRCAVSLALCAGVWTSFAGSGNARNCSCNNIGLGICIPDFACSQAQKQIYLDVGKAVEKGTYDTGAAIEKAVKDSTITQMKILATGYAQLADPGKEDVGYGLYSYAVLTSHSDQTSAFLGEIFKSIPPIEDTVAQRAQLNIFYIPIKRDASSSFAESAKTLEQKPNELGARYSQSFYDYKMARSVLYHICNPPAETIRELCEGDFSRGPYIFTYSKPASTLEPVPPPFLFVDLSDIDARAYGEIVAAFRAQVKREDIADGVRINSLRLRLLNIALKASDIIGPVKKAMADIVHPGSDKPEDTSKK
jgi:hypothetical protein